MTLIIYNPRHVYGYVSQKKRHNARVLTYLFDVTAAVPMPFEPPLAAAVTGYLSQRRCAASRRRRGVRLFHSHIVQPSLQAICFPLMLCKVAGTVQHSVEKCGCECLVDDVENMTDIMCCMKRALKSPNTRDTPAQKKKSSTTLAWIFQHPNENEGTNLYKLQRLGPADDTTVKDPSWPSI